MTSDSQKAQAAELIAQLRAQGQLPRRSQTFYQEPSQGEPGHDLVEKQELEKQERLPSSGWEDPAAIVALPSGASSGIRTASVDECFDIPDVEDGSSDDTSETAKAGEDQGDDEGESVDAVSELATDLTLSSGFAYDKGEQTARAAENQTIEAEPSKPPPTNPHASAPPMPQPAVQKKKPTEDSVPKERVFVWVDIDCDNLDRLSDRSIIEALEKRNQGLQDEVPPWLLVGLANLMGPVHSLVKIQIPPGVKKGQKLAFTTDGVRVKAVYNGGKSAGSKAVFAVQERPVKEKKSFTRKLSRRFTLGRSAVPSQRTESSE